jgi:peptidoglycan/xylan/chitin deacetylase (PgdA/CDA1 family)
MHSRSDRPDEYGYLRASRSGLGLAACGSMSKRAVLASVLESTGITDLALGVQRRIGTPWLRIVTFHRARVGGDASFPLDEGVIDITPHQLSRRLEMVKKHFTPIGTDEMIAHLGGAPLPANPILISFDDGYRDNFDVVLPILARHRVKAVFFIATAYVTERRVFWWDRINYLIKHSTRTSIVVTYPIEVRVNISTRGTRRSAIAWLLQLVKQAARLDLSRFLDDLAEAAGVAWTPQLERQLADENVMTWDQVRALRAAGMAVESHTRTHRVLQTLDARELATELRGSREELESELGAPVRAISYPVGQRIENRADIRAALVSAGYQIGFTNAGNVTPTSVPDRYDVGRIPMDSGTSDSMFRALLAAPSLFS